MAIRAAASPARPTSEAHEMNSKPSTCLGCPLYSKGAGFALPDGPESAPILIMGEALGKEEAKKSRPFVGPSGYKLDTALQMVGLSREQVRVHNIVSCQPPNDWLTGAPWEHEAIYHCQRHRAGVLANPAHQVVLALGSTASRVLLEQPKKKWKLNNWHSTVTEINGKLVVPTYHPAFLLRGQQKLTGAWLYAFKIAQQALKGWVKEDASLIVDPPVEGFVAWVEDFLQSPQDKWLAVDIETPEKLAGAEEDELEDSTYQIIRVNFAYHPDEGITVPWQEPYISYARKLIEGAPTLCFWNERYDVPRLSAAGIHINQSKVLDWMWGWHMLQSDLPRGLGFAAPFYSRFGAWKHLSGENPGLYAAIDAVQTLRCAFGISRDLQAAGQWDSFLRYVRDLDTYVLHPAEDVGLPFNLDAMVSFGRELKQRSAVIEEEARKLYPESCLPLTPKAGWKRYPKDKQGVIEKRWFDEVGQKEEVRYFVRDEFNLASNDQILAYLQHKNFKTTKAKKAKTNKPSTDKNNLDRLAKKDRFCQLVLDYRSVQKVLSTYVVATLTRVGKENLLDPIDPSTTAGV